jgi:hypothetical protein
MLSICRAGDFLGSAFKYAGIMAGVAGLINTEDSYKLLGIAAGGILYTIGDQLKTSHRTTEEVKIGLALEGRLLDLDDERTNKPEKTYKEYYNKSYVNRTFNILEEPEDEEPEKAQENQSQETAPPENKPH